MQRTLSRNVYIKRISQRAFNFSLQHLIWISILHDLLLSSCFATSSPSGIDIMAPSFAQVVTSCLLVSSVIASPEIININSNVLRGVSHDLGVPTFRNAKKDNPQVSTNLPMPWMYQGCYSDGSPRTIQGASYSNQTAMTVESCISYCDSQNYIYAGLEYMYECYCGNSTSTAKVEPSTDCNMACSGNSSEACGAGNRLSVYWNGEPSPGGPWTDPGTDGYGFLGCYT